MSKWTLWVVCNASWAQGPFSTQDEAEQWRHLNCVAGDMWPCVVPLNGELAPEMAELLARLADEFEAYASEGNGVTPRVCDAARALLAKVSA